MYLITAGAVEAKSVKSKGKVRKMTKVENFAHFKKIKDTARANAQNIASMQKQLEELKKLILQKETIIVKERNHH